ncbi:MAG: diaminohydroxyphosphoribosylaminopyrimidine deaminase [Solirubrobacteraceae bacterium]|nr:diaminohydroxyphosphoribosylaminopyrimidine deaminase [Solirubrobacteraceae bacterium]
MRTTVNGAQPDVATSSCWRALKLLAERIRDDSGPVTSCSLLIGEDPHVCVGPESLPAGDGWPVTVIVDPATQDHLPALAPGETRYLLDELIVMRRLADGGLPAAASALIELYVPYCLAPLHARRMKRAFTVSHFAQSLDGRIATRAGDARWIGCEENRVHAHRMRALCDGILIGAHTLRTDRPALTVRHAEGSDPIRIVLGGAGDIGCLERAGSSAIVLIGDDLGPSSAQVEHVVLPRTNGRIATTAILEELYRNDILSVYIEGGATTTSTFLSEGNIDVLQLHISPMIIGPGINSFAGPSIQSIQDSVRFDPHVYRSVGDGMMFVGRVAS